MSYDQSFNHLILDYPLQSLRFFASAEAGNWLAGARTVPVRQVQFQPMRDGRRRPDQKQRNVDSACTSRRWAIAVLAQLESL